MRVRLYERGSGTLPSRLGQGPVSIVYPQITLICADLVMQREDMEKNRRKSA